MATNARHPQGVVKTGRISYIDPAAIRRKPGFNPRFDFGDIEALARSIAANGVLNPLRVRKVGVGQFELVDGDRRFTAIELLVENRKRGKQPQASLDDSVAPCIIVDDAQDEVTDLLQMFEANTGKEFLPLEKAAAFKKMRDSGLTLKQIEQRTGCSDNDIVGCLALLEGDGELVAAARDGKISGGTAKAIAVNARGDKELQKKLTQQAAAAGKDKGARAAVKKAIDDARRDRATKRGQVLKMRALSDKELSEMGAALAQKLAAKLEAAGIALDADLRQWASKDPELAIAFSFGALEALKAAAGVKVELEVGP